MTDTEFEDDIPKAASYAHLVGKVHTFEDGDRIEIIQVKQRDDGPWITYHTFQGPGIPRKYVALAVDFLDMYGHLFGEEP